MTVAEAPGAVDAPGSAREIATTVATEQYNDLAELAGSFIHDVKNHIGTLGLNLQNLEEDFQDPQSPRERRALERIQRMRNECQRLLDVSNDFLRFARVKDLDLVPTDLTEVIEELIDFFGPLARSGNIEIKSYLPSDLPAVALDRNLFKQALLNLLLNAQQAMPNGGELTLQASRDSSGVTLSLIDTGKGMAPEVAAKAFRPFYSTRPSGTGLGLPTTRKIIEAHRGSIDLESEVGHGTKFTIRLPVLAASKE
jgi:signal transduction histidine kinase